MKDIIFSYLPYIDKKQFDTLLDKIDGFAFDKSGGNSKCAIIDNYAILRTGNIPGHDDSFIRIINTLNKLKEKGVNVVPILGYGVVEVGEVYSSGKRFDRGYIIQEKAVGNELLFPKELRGKSDEDCRVIIKDYLDKLRNAPQDHFNKWMSDFKEIDAYNIAIDPSKESNFFFDVDKGFSFIDLNFFKKSVFNEIEQDGKIHHTKFILGSFTPFNRLFKGQYDKYFQNTEDVIYIENVKKELLEKYIIAANLIGVSKEDIEYTFDQYGLKITSPNENQTSNISKGENNMNTNVDNKNGFSYKTIDVKNTSIGEISKEKHFENVKYQFVCETINNLFGNEYTGLCAIKPKDPQNIEIIKRARRVWQAMAYDNGMRIVAPNGAEISVRDMLRKYYQEADGYKQDRIVTNLLPNPNIPDEIKSLFEDLYATRGLYGMAEIIEHDVDLAIGRNPNDVISQAINSYSNYEPPKWMTISEYNGQCNRGDIQFETARYLQQNYNLLGGYNDSTKEQKEYAQGSQKMLLDWLSKSLDIAKSREERLSGMGENSI